VKFITVSGIDKSGKTSIIDAYMTKTKYRDYLVDRDPSNYMALNDIQDRIKDIDQMDNYYGFMIGYKHNVDLAVLLTCKPSALEKRFKLNHEPDLVGNLSFEDHQDKIMSYFIRADYPNSLIIDTTDKTVNQCVNLIIKHSQE
jgi:thymidylate kinase